MKLICKDSPILEAHHSFGGDILVCINLNYQYWYEGSLKCNSTRQSWLSGPMESQANKPDLAFTRFTLEQGLQMHLIRIVQTMRLLNHLTTYEHCIIQISYHQQKLYNSSSSSKARGACSESGMEAAPKSSAAQMIKPTFRLALKAVQQESPLARSTFQICRI